MGGRQAERLVVAVLVAAACVACATAPRLTPVPTFAAPTPGADAPAGGGPGDELPAECAGVLATGDLGALLGLPLDSVAVRTTIGIAEPSVGRTARVACRYTGNAEAGAARGATLLEINSARYTDPAAGANQWRVNTDAESGERRDLEIGAASAAVFDRPRESVLMVVYGITTITLVLPDRPLPGDRPRSEALVDLALRVLPAVAPDPPAPPTTQATVPEPAAAVGPS